MKEGLGELCDGFGALCEGILITGALNVGFGALCEELGGLYDGFGAM